MCSSGHFSGASGTGGTPSPSHGTIEWSWVSGGQQQFFGGTIQIDCFRGYLFPFPLLRPTYSGGFRLWSAAQRLLRIDLLEMEAVRLALLAFRLSLRRSHMLLRTDNTSVACYFSRQGGVRSPSLSIAAEGILLWCFKEAIVISAQHVLGWLNVLADGLGKRGVVRFTD